VELGVEEMEEADTMEMSLVEMEEDSLPGVLETAVTKEVAKVEATTMELVERYKTENMELKAELAASKATVLQLENIEQELANRDFNDESDEEEIENDYDFGRMIEEIEDMQESWGKDLEKVLRENSQEVASSQDIISKIKKALTNPQIKTTTACDTGKKDKAGEEVPKISKKAEKLEHDKVEHSNAPGKPKVFDARSLMTATDHQSQYKCNICGKEGRSTSIQYHIESEHAHNAEGPNRGETSINSLNTTQLKETINENTVDVIDEKNLELQGTFPCTVCERKLKSKRTLKSHMKNQHKDISNSIENKMLETNKETTLDTSNTGDPQLEVKETIFACHMCDKTYKLKGSLNSHMTRNHRNKRLEEEETKDNDRGIFEKGSEEDNNDNEGKENKESDDKYDSDKEERDAPKETKEYEETMEDDNEVETLSECNEEFLCYFCDQCDHRTDSEESLIEHKQEEHAKLKCRECDTELKSKSNLRKHYKNKHGVVSLDEFKELFYKGV